jgi:hypothetical protein
MRLFRLALAALIACALTFGQVAEGAAPAIPPPAPSVTFRSGPTIACVGDSECQQGTVNIPVGSVYTTATGYQIGTFANSIIGWLQVVSGGGFVVDFANQSYPGSYNGLYYVRFLTRGTGCPANTTVTITPSTPTFAPINTPANLTFTTDANGNTPVVGTTIFETAGANQGSGYAANPSFTINKTCTVPPTFGYALTGSGSFGVNGDTTPNWAQRIQTDVCKAKPDWAINVIGTNDLTGGVLTEAQINANTLKGLQYEQACGIRTILLGIAPRVIGVGGWTQAMDTERLRINAWRRNLALVTQAGNIASTLGLGAIGGLVYPVIYVDVDHLWNDPTQSGATAGNPNFANTIDGLHQSSIGAFYYALAVWNQVKTFFPPGGPNIPNTQNDVYNATNNPAGNLLGTQGLFLGISGTATGPCATSSGVAANWNIQQSGNSSMSCVGTLETTRSDGLPGQRQVVTISDTGGTTGDKVTLADFVSLSANVSAGDQLVFEGDLDLSNLNQVLNVGCELFETNSGTSQAASATFSGSINGYSSSNPNFNSAAIAKLNEAKNLPDFGVTAAGSFRMHFRTGTLTVQASGDTGWITQCVVYLNGASGTATATIKAGNFMIRKLNAT